MGILDSIGKDAGDTAPFYINTGTIFDMATGAFRAGVKNNSVLNGGIGFSLGVAGRPETFKSNIAGSLVARAMLIHPLSKAIVYDTENSMNGAYRYDDFVPEDTPVSNRIKLCNATSMDLAAFEDLIKDLTAEKLQCKKDLCVDSPFMNPTTNKPYKTWIPTFVVIDSLSQGMSKSVQEMYDKNDIDASGMNTAALRDGLVKSRIVQDLTQRAVKAGIYVLFTAHVDSQPQLDPYAPNPKDLQFMKHGDKMKNVGTKFKFLLASLLQTLKAEPMMDSNKQCLYPYFHSRPNEVRHVTTILQRGKNNSSGESLPLLVSAKQGILNSLTNFNFLREHKNYGMKVEGNNQYFTPLFRPDVKLTRTTIRKATENDYQLNRALEVLTQLAYIQLCWEPFRLPEYMFMDPRDLAELLTHTEKPVIDRILNSTGSWSTSKQERELLSIIDIMNLLCKVK